LLRQSKISANLLLSRKFQTFSGLQIEEMQKCVGQSHLAGSKSAGQLMYKVSETVRTTHGQDGAVVLDIRQGQMFNLNPVGSRIVELLKSGNTELQIADQLGREFGIGRDVAEKDLQEFLQALKNHRLIEDCEQTVVG